MNMAGPDNNALPPKKKSWTRSLAVAFAMAAAGFYSSSSPGTGGLNLTKAAIAGAIGALAAMIGYGVGKLIDAASD